MKQILLLSDTHGHIDDAILGHAGAADEVWHAGDIGDEQVTDALEGVATLRAVHGNIDGHRLRSAYPEHQRFSCEGVDTWITHIGGYPGRYDKRVREAIRADPPRLFICGHSHILKVVNDKALGLLHMNPGACGKYGFHQVRTMLRFALDDGNITDLTVIELGKR